MNWEINKKGQSETISVILLILIAIVSVVIIWNVVNPLITEKGGEIDISKITTNLNIKEAVRFINGASKVTVQRNMGQGEITSLKFVFYDSNGNSHVETKNSDLINEYETKTYSFGPIPLEDVAKVSVVPYFKKTSGMEFKAESSGVFEMPSSLVAWWKFDENSNDFAGSNDCSEVVIVDDNERGKVAKFESTPNKCGNNASLSINNEIGLSFWIKTSGDGIVIEKGDNYKVSIGDGRVVFNYKGKERKSNLAVNDYQWHYVAISMLSTYIDGEADSLSIIEGVSSTNSEEVSIGKFNGYLDEVMIFDNSLSFEQISSMYLMQK
jgi:flagellin-like protein